MTKGQEVVEVTVRLNDGTEITVSKDLFLEKVREEYLDLLPEPEVDKEEMYRMIGFSSCVLDRIANSEAV